MMAIGKKDIEDIREKVINEEETFEEDVFDNFDGSVVDNDKSIYELLEEDIITSDLSDADKVKDFPGLSKFVTRR